MTSSSSSLCSACCLLLKEKTQHVLREWMQYRYVTVVCVSVHLLAVLQCVLLSTADRQFVPVSLHPARRDLDSWAWNTWEQETAQSLLQQNMSALVRHLEFCWSVSPLCQFYSSRKKEGNSEVVLYEHRRTCAQSDCTHLLRSQCSYCSIKSHCLRPLFVISYWEGVSKVCLPLLHDSKYESVSFF